MSLNDFIKNRPFEPDAEVLELLRNWPAPDFQAAPQKKTTKTNALYKTPPQPGVRLAARLPQEEEIKPLTAEDIEQIRQAAFDEGLGQGKEEGFSQGYAEGREQGYQDGLQQGQAEGRKTGLAEGEQLIRDQLAQLQLLIEQLQQPLQQIDQRVEQSLLDLAIAMAQAVVAVEVKTNPQVILQTLRQAIDALPLKANQIQIRLHPQDLAVIMAHYSVEDLAERQWQLRAEPALALGDIRIDAGDSSVERQLKHRLQHSLEHFLQSSDHSE
jgi:flagellar assembly protein FliH